MIESVDKIITQKKDLKKGLVLWKIWIIMHIQCT